MASYTWEFGAEGAGLHFSITYDDSTGEFKVSVFEGAFNLNALYLSGAGQTGNYLENGDEWNKTKSDNSLNMNGANTVWDDGETDGTYKDGYDLGFKLSDAGLGHGTDWYLEAGDDPNNPTTNSFTFLGLTIDENTVLGVRATSVDEFGSIKWVDKEPEIDGGEELNYFTLLSDNEGNLDIREEDQENANDNREVEGFNAASGIHGDENEESPDGTDGEHGLDAIAITEPDTYAGIKIISDGDEPNVLLGGSGGNGGEGSDGGAGVNGGDGGNGGHGGHAIVNGEDLSKVIIVGKQHLSILGGSGGNGGEGGEGGSVTTGTITTNSTTLTAGDGGDGGDGGAGGTGIGDGGDGGHGGDVVSGNINGTGVNLTAGDGGDGGIGGGDGGDGGDVDTGQIGNVNNTTLIAGTGGDGGDGGGSSGDAGEVEHGNINPNAKDTSISHGGDSFDGLPYLTENPIIGAFSHSVDVDASDFEGDLTISGSNYLDGVTSGDDTMVFGSGMTKVYATTGDDNYDVSNGAVTVTYTWHGQSDGTEWTDTIDGWGDDDDIIDVSGMYFGDLNFQGLVDNAGDLDFNSLAWFREGDNTYVVADVNGNGEADFKVELLGAEFVLSAADFVL